MGIVVIVHPLNNDERFWNYSLTVELINIEDTALINQLFDRLNRNVRKLTRQELRHANFDGWFINLAESESEKDEWEELGISTKARVKRMKDVQFISELLLLLLERKLAGFDQDWLDDRYGHYDDPPEDLPRFSEKAFLSSLSKIKKYVAEMNAHEKVISQYASGYSNFYSLWGALVLAKKWPAAEITAERYLKFMRIVDELGQQKDLNGFLAEQDKAKQKALANPYAYALNNVGAPTDLTPRKARHEALVAELFK